MGRLISARQNKLSAALDCSSLSLSQVTFLLEGLQLDFSFILISPVLYGFHFAAEFCGVSTKKNNNKYPTFWEGTNKFWADKKLQISSTFH